MNAISTILSRLIVNAGDIKPSHKGLLHKHLGIPEGEDIPLERLKEAKNSDDPEIRKEANYAINVRK